jgi:hypothetical protein
LCIETSKELRTRLAEVVYEEHADQSLNKQLVTCSMDTAYPPIRNRIKEIYTSILENRLSIIIIESILVDRRVILLVIIIPGVMIIIFWFFDNMIRHELLIVSESGYTNKGIYMVWLDYFIKYNNYGPNKK